LVLVVSVALLIAILLVQRHRGQRTKKPYHFVRIRQINHIFRKIGRVL
jgi:hypothetical protein